MRLSLAERFAAGLLLIAVPAPLHAQVGPPDESEAWHAPEGAAPAAIADDGRELYEAIEARPWGLPWLAEGLIFIAFAALFGSAMLAGAWEHGRALARRWFAVETNRPPGDRNPPGA